MPEAAVKRIEAVAVLGDVDAALAEARRSASGDAEWWDLIEQEQDGRVVIVSLQLSLEAAGADGRSFQLARTYEPVWASVPRHLPDLEEELRGIAAGEVSAFAVQLRNRGLEVDDVASGRMYVHVRLADDLCAYVREARARQLG